MSTNICQVRPLLGSANTAAGWQSSGEGDNLAGVNCCPAPLPTDATSIAAPKREAPPAKAPATGRRRRSLSAEDLQAATAADGPSRTLQQAAGKALGAGTPLTMPPPAAIPAHPAAGTPAANPTPAPTASISAIAARAPPQLVSLTPKVPPLPRPQRGAAACIHRPGAGTNLAADQSAAATSHADDSYPAGSAGAAAAGDPGANTHGRDLLQVGENIINECVDEVAPLPLGRYATSLRPFGGGQTWHNCCLNIQGSMLECVMDD